jgi:hypothetical protein
VHAPSFGGFVGVRETELTTLGSETGEASGQREAQGAELTSWQG